MFLREYSKKYDVQGIVERAPIRLKIAGQRDFIFDGIIIGSSYKKLESLLQELGIRKIKKKINIQEITRRLLLVLTLLLAEGLKDNDA